MSKILRGVSVSGCDSVIVQAWSDHNPKLVEVVFARPKPAHKPRMKHPNRITRPKEDKA